MSQRIINGDSAAVLKQFASDSIDAVITDPPYGIEFLGKEWDQDTGAIDIWRECLRVLKPGGHLLAFSAARTYHHLATNVESVGFEIRDQLMWIYASGFPKAQDIGKAIDKRGVANEWHGWKTALKPAHEPIVMARKPFKGSTTDNVLEHGVGALNIDATRIESTPERIAEVRRINAAGGLPAADGIDKYGTIGEANRNKRQQYQLAEGRYPSNVVGEIADYQKYFYCPKVSRRERHRGFEQQNIPTNPEGMYAVDGTGVQYNSNKYKAVGNNHPTVKPVALMRYLIKLVTPAGAHILDPFSGSGSTGMACKELARGFTGIDLDGHYCEIAEKRIAATQELKTETLFDPQQAEPKA